MTSTTGGQKTFFTIMSEFRNFINRCPHDYTEALNQFSGKVLIIIIIIIIIIILIIIIIIIIIITTTTTII